jgi:WD40 repeat protein
MGGWQTKETPIGGLRNFVVALVGSHTNYCTVIKYIRQMSSKQADRLARQAAIAALAAEMMGSSAESTFEAHPKQAKEAERREQELKAALASASSEGAVFVDEETVDAGADNEREQWSSSAGPPRTHSSSSSSSSSSASASSSLKSAAVDPTNDEDDDTNEDGNNATTENSLDQFAVDNKIPITHQVELGGHSKAVTYLSIPPTGNRVITGSLDYSIKIFDFGGMDSRQRAFKSLEVQSGHPVQSISHSPNGDRFIVATGSATPYVYDKDGQFIIKFIKGDMYIRDQSQTKGHTMEVTCCQWHPTQKDTVLTASLDGSIRLWDLLGLAHFGDLTSKHVLKLKGQVATQTRLGATACCFSPTGNRILGAGSDGAIYIWFEKKTYSKADIVLKSEYFTSSISSVSVSPDGMYLAARAPNQDNILMWDFSSIGTKMTTVLTPAQQKPLLRITDVCNEYPTSNAEFSPDSKFVCCAAVTRSSSSSSSSASSTKSLLQFYHIPSLLQMLPDPSFYPLVVSTPTVKIGLGAASIFVKWQPKINQIFCRYFSIVWILYFDGIIRFSVHLAPPLVTPLSSLTSEYLPREPCCQREKQPDAKSNSLQTMRFQSGKSSHPWAKEIPCMPCNEDSVIRRLLQPRLLLVEEYQRLQSL